MSELFEYINHIFDKKEYDKAIPYYAPYIINKGMSMHIDTILFGNEMNMNAHLSHRMQYDYLYYSVRKGKRYTKWANKSKKNFADLELIKEYYGYNITKARQALGILSDEDIETIRKKLVKGGLNE